MYICFNIRIANTIQSDVYKKAEKYQRLVFDGFGTMARHPDPCKTIFQRFFSYFKPEFPDNCNVNVVQVGDEFFAMTELPIIKKVDPESLDVRASVGIWRKRLAGRCK